MTTLSHSPQVQSILTFKSYFLKKEIVIPAKAGIHHPARILRELAECC